MAITNLDKPDTGVPQTELNIGDGFNLLVGGIYQLIIGAIGAGGMTNADRAQIYETWATITTTWASETRTWLDMTSIIDNVAKATYGNPLWTSQLVWQLNLPWQVNTSIMTNAEKP